MNKQTNKQKKNGNKQKNKSIPALKDIYDLLSLNRRWWFLSLQWGIIFMKDDSLLPTDF